MQSNFDHTNRHQSIWRSVVPYFLRHASYSMLSLVVNNGALRDVWKVLNRSNRSPRNMALKRLRKPGLWPWWPFSRSHLVATCGVQSVRRYQSVHQRECCVVPQFLQHNTILRMGVLTIIFYKEHFETRQPPRMFTSLTKCVCSVRRWHVGTCAMFWIDMIRLHLLPVH